MIKHQSGNSQKNNHYNAYVYTDMVWHSHFHASYELIAVLEGCVQITFGGVTELLQKGELLLISPYTVHGFTVKKDSRAWVGVFSQDHIQVFANTHAQTQYSKFRCEKTTEGLLSEQLFLEGKPDRYLRIALLYAVCDSCHKNAHPMQVRGDLRPICEVVEYICENLDNDISMGELASHLGYEYHYFSALFHQWFGMNFKTFLNLFRFEKACDMLLGTSKDITEIYRACGFAGIRNFNRVFKELGGCTPSEYRRAESATHPKTVRHA